MITRRLNRDLDELAPSCRCWLCAATFPPGCVYYAETVPGGSVSGVYYVCQRCGSAGVDLAEVASLTPERG